MTSGFPEHRIWRLTKGEHGAEAWIRDLGDRHELRVFVDDELIWSEVHSSELDGDPYVSAARKCGEFARLGWSGPGPQREAAADPVKAPLSTPAGDDIVLVRMGTDYAVLRSSGIGMSAGRRVGDPAAIMPRPVALAVGHALGAAQHVDVWIMDDVVATFVETYRQPLR